ncbi:restriction endonuclease subunit S [Rhizobium laguerreae]|uniref:restriction endonuclease subunit S n=1 Tax=Rhizobium laguerreae TaxID=1076926 RepID=UPI001C91E33A|nr:restriction endonuclease subunit S [Rhizobium laguerreae]MBY3227511.1 restriction endonuclease subunit S [Rhizobium laguerreae]
MNAESLLEHYEKMADAPDAIARLRRFILDLAIRGKLVPQDPNDEPASELMKQIDREKARFAAEGKIRSANPIETADAPAFQWHVPGSWAAVRVSNVLLSSFYGPRFGADEYTADGIPTIRTTDMTADGRIVLLDPPRVAVPKDRLNDFRCRDGDLLVTRTGSIGTMALFTGEILAIPSAYLIRLRFSQNVSPKYIHLVLRSPSGQNSLGLGTTKVAQPNINAKAIATIPFTLPPLPEQHRIVAKVDELMALCDQLETARTTREATRDRLAAASLARLNTPDPETFADDAHFAFDALPALTARPDQIKQLRQTILNLAVRGKLVPQDPKDEPAEELLKRIAEERDELVKSKVIRRDGLLDPVLATEHPFAIPATWSWARIGDVVHFTQYGTSQKSHPSEKGVPVLTMGNVQDGRVVWSNEKRIPEDSSDLPDLYLRKYDLLYNRTNSAELVGKTGIYIGEDRKRTFASYLIRLRPSLRWSAPHFINLAMNTSVFRETQIVPLIKKQTGQANVNGSALKNMLVPLPPLAEQHRIIAKVDELTSLCDRLETSLTTADDTRRELLDALLAKALAPVNAEHLQAAAE